MDGYIYSYMLHAWTHAHAHKYIHIYLHTGPALGGAGPSWEQFQSAQVTSQLAPRSVLDNVLVHYTLAGAP